VVQGQLQQILIETPISKITRAKWTGGVAQVVEHLLYKHKPQSHQKKIMVGGQPEQKLVRPYISENKLSMVAHFCDPRHK
jgi:hypothetical protein